MRLSLGVYPEVGLREAQASGENSFEAVTREWFARHAPGWAESHSKRMMQLFERDVFPWIGARPIGDIEAPELLTILRHIEKRGAIETAHRARTKCGQVFRYAVATARSKRDPSADLRGALPPVKNEHFAATTDPKRLGEILRAMDAYQGTPPVRCAVRLTPLVFVRSGELRHAEWKAIDLDAADGASP